MLLHRRTDARLGFSMEKKVVNELASDESKSYQLLQQINCNLNSILTFAPANAN